MVPNLTTPHCLTKSFLEHSPHRRSQGYTETQRSFHLGFINRTWTSGFIFILMFIFIFIIVSSKAAPTRNGCFIAYPSTIYTTLVQKSRKISHNDWHSSVKGSFHRSGSSRGSSSTLTQRSYLCVFFVRSEKKTKKAGGGIFEGKISQNSSKKNIFSFGAEKYGKLRFMKETDMF